MAFLVVVSDSSLIILGLDLGLILIRTSGVILTTTPVEKHIEALKPSSLNESRVNIDFLIIDFLALQSFVHY